MNALFIGKFRILTNKHFEIISNALEEYEHVVIALVSSKKTIDTLSLRKNMLEETFGNKIIIIEVSSANFLDIFEKSPYTIDVVLCGTDRKEGYERMAKGFDNLFIKEIKRTDEDLSATKIFQNIENKEYFENNTPSTIHKFYEILKR